MNFYTLTYDADLPAVQQVNVPTNSDYKVGMKVKRNGEVQSIKPSEFTVYTGETTPTEQETAALEKTFESGYYTIGDDGLLVYDNFGEIEPEKLYPIITNATVTVGSQTLQINVADIRMSLDSPAGQWKPYEVDGKMVWKDVNTSETRDYVETAGYDLMIELPKAKYAANGFTTALEQSAADNGYSGSATIVTKPAEDVPVTYPVDPQKTNGYVTITKASGDDASFKQYEVNVETEAPTKFEDTRTASSKDGNVLCRVLEAQLSAYGGQRIYAKDIHLFQSNDNVNWREVLDSTNNINYIRLTVDKTSTFAMKYLTTAYPDYQYGKWAYWPDPEDVENIEWLDYVEIPTSNPRIMTSIHPATLTIPDASKFTYPCYFKMTVQIGADQIVANFKLNINEFKSQSGDIAETLADGTSVKVDGTYADGTTFSFDFCTK